MAKEPQRAEEQDGGEFADFLADVSQEIAQRVESLDARARPEVEEARKTRSAEAPKRTPPAADAGLIADWPSIVDRMIEEMR